MRKNWSLIAVIFVGLFLAGCAGMFKSSTYLPSSKTITSVPWKSFDEVKSVYDNIIPGKTTLEELKKMGFDPFTAPNIKILNSTDIINRFMPNSSIRREDLDEGIQKAIEAKSHCFGYLVEIQITDEENMASFVKHILRFKRQTQESGWQFKGLILIVNNIVIYKDTIGGQPKIKVEKIQKNPLGPFQEMGDWIIGIGRGFAF